MIPIYLQKRWQKTQWNKLKDSAGPRYTPEVDVRLPVSEIFEGLGRTKGFFKEVKELKDRLQEETKKITVKVRPYKKDVQARIPKIQKACESITKIIDDISKDSSLELPFHKTIPINNRVFKHIRAIYDVINKQEDKELEESRILKQGKPEQDTRYDYHKDSDYLSTLKSLRDDLRKISGVLMDIDTLSKSLKARLSNEPFVFLLGKAGMGKTHLLCDITKKRLNDDYQTIIVLGEELPKISSPINEILKARNISNSESDFLKKLNKFGSMKRSRVLLVVDAINESDIKGWKKELRGFKTKLKKYPWIGVVLSCRTPFEEIIIPKSLNVNKEYHRGFNDYEFEAMKAFFGHYRIPLPEVPVLISEFGNPLFLSSFCKTAVSLRDGRRKVAKKIKDIALGQKGMTTILEDFYVSKQAEIFKKESINYRGIIDQNWLWNKTSGGECLIKLFAKTMANAEKEFLTLNEAKKLMALFFQNKYKVEVYSNLIDLLLHYGVLIKDLSYSSHDSKYHEVIKFPFQKFSDHLIARYFLENHLDTNKIRKSFGPTLPLGKLFKDEQSLYLRANLAEAVIVEFTEWVKRNKYARDKDITDYLARNLIHSPIFRQVYLSALYWRRPDNFLDSNGKIKDSIIDYINKVLLRYKDSSRELTHLLISTAVKPKHPLNHKALSNWLSKMTMVKRDTFWTEYLRNSYEADPIYRLISWIEEHDISKISEAHAEAVISVLSWCLSTTSHLLRNRATRCIYLIGSIWPKVCFEQTIWSLSINDLYIRERMLAVSYGISMRYVASGEANDSIKVFSKQIFDSFFTTKAKYSTTHVYIRNYARGIVELALHKKLLSLDSKSILNIRPPYKTGGIRRWGRSQEKNRDEYRDGNAPLGMDFENYTLGRLVENRNNYDFKNLEYKKVKANVLWRLYDLGYSLETFGKIDKEIVSSQRMTRSDYPTKIDRYGKKYSWIAYYELMGLRADKKLINPFFAGDSYRESDNDIDPSFPILEENKFPIETNILNGPKKMKEWLAKAPTPDIGKYIKLKLRKVPNSEWVLVDGTIGQLNEDTAKRNSIYINGVFVKKDNKKKFRKHLNRVQHMGDESIPRYPEVRSEYLGELGWHPDYSRPEKILTSRFVIGHKKVKVNRRFRSFRFIFGDEEKVTEMPEYSEWPIYEKINIKRVGRYCSSKDYRRMGSEDGLGLHIPSNNVIKLLNLHKDPNGYNFYDKSGKLATISFTEGGQYKTHKNLLYIRKDLLEKLKKSYKMDFFLCVEGERQYWPKDLGLIHNDEFSAIYQKRKNMHRQFVDL